MINTIKKITSLKNEEIKNIIKLKKQRERKKQKLILIEGKHEISMAVDSGMEIIKLYHSPEFASDENFFINDAETVIIKKEVFKSLSQRENPDGYLAVAKPKKIDFDSIMLSKSPLIIILENVEKPGNIGAVLRTADAVNADVVIVCDPKTDIYNPNVIRASLGTVFSNQVLTCTSKAAINFLKSKKIKIISATLKGKKIYTDTNLNQPLALVMGNEHSGVTTEWIRNSSELVKIPMLGKIDSLNVSVSTAIIIYEALRQRSNR